MAKSKKAENNTAVESQTTSEVSVEQTEVVEAGPSLTDLLDKMKKDGKSYVRVKKLF